MGSSLSPKKMLDRLQASLRGEIEPPPIARLLGFRLTAIEPGQATIELDADERLANPMGTLHGGVLCDIADAAMGLAWASLLEEGETFTTVELKINFLRPVWNSHLRAIGHVIKNGRMLGLIECRILDEDDRMVAHATSTCMTLRGELANGR